MYYINNTQKWKIIIKTVTEVQSVISLPLDQVFDYFLAFFMMIFWMNYCIINIGWAILLKPKLDQGTQKYWSQTCQINKQQQQQLQCIYTARNIWLSELYQRNGWRLSQSVFLGVIILSIHHARKINFTLVNLDTG